MQNIHKAQPALYGGFFEACYSGDLKRVEELLKKKTVSNVNVRTKYGITGLDIAAMKG